MSSIDRNLHAKLIPGPQLGVPTGQRLARADADAKCRCYQVSLKIPKVKSRLGFAILFVTVKLLKMTAMSNEAESICIKERKYRKKQLINIWHELCSIAVTVSIATILKRKGVKNNDELV
jgi:hypothetical protein